LTKPEIICKILDQVDPFLDELVQKHGLNAEDVEAILDALKARFQNGL